MNRLFVLLFFVSLPVVFGGCLTDDEPESSYEEVDLDSESAGIYYLPDKGSDNDIILRYKMELLWHYYNESEAVVLGSSRPLNGVVSKEISSASTVLNLSNVPNSMYVSSYLYLNYIKTHFDKLKFVIIGLDIDMWFKVKDRPEHNFFYEGYKAYPGYVYDQKQNFWKGKNVDSLYIKTSAAPGKEYHAKKLLPSLGFNEEYCGSWEENPVVEHDSAWMKTDSSAFYANLEELRDIVESAREDGVIVVGIIFPQSPNFKKTGSFGRYGLRRSEAPGLIQKIKDLSKKYSNFVLMDENKMGDHDYEEGSSQNKDHLCTNGAHILTKRLDSLLKTL